MTDETRVLIGGRKFRKIPPQSQLFVESEDLHGSVRQRRVITSTPLNTPNHPPPPFNSPNYWTPPQLLKPKPHQNYHHDSGFYGSFNTPDSSQQSYPSLNTTSTPYKPNLWHNITSPVRNIKNRFTGGGRPTFLDDERSGRWKVQPQQILGCLLFLTIFSSIGFTILISIKHFGVEQAGSELVSGKYQSLKFANEKINVEAASAVELVDAEVKAPTIHIPRIDDTLTDSNEIPFSEELLTPRPLVVEHPAPTKAPGARNVARNEASDKSEKTTETVTETVMIIVVDSDNENDVSKDSVDSLSDARAEPDYCPHKPKSKESSDSVQEVQEAKSRKKSRRVNPLTKTLKVQKMSKAKMVEKVTTILRDIKSFDYPDLPTFRGLQPDGEETAGKNYDVEYPEDPYYSGIIRSKL